MRDGAKKLLSAMGGSSDDVDSDAEGDELVTVAQEILDAIEAKDAEGLCSALESFISKCSYEDDT